MRYDVMVTRFPGDGAALALHATDAPLVLLTRGQAADLGPLPDGAREIMFCGRGGEPVADHLDRLRASLDGRHPSAAVVVAYDRLASDLPSLREDDRLTCWWEAGDLLTDAMLDDFRYLAERLALDGAGFDGLHFYLRNEAGAVRQKVRLAELESILGPLSPRTVQL